jgi:AraC family transcriptional regulator
MTLFTPALRREDNVFSFAPDVSSNTLWPDLKLDLYQWPARHQSSQPSTWHTATFNVGAPIHLSWKSNHEWTKTGCDTGSLVNLLSPEAGIETAWDQEFRALTLSISPAYLERLVEMPNFRFSEQHAVADPFLKEVVQLLYVEMCDGNFTEKIYTENLLVACILHLATEYPASGKKLFAPKGKLSAHQLKNVVDYTHAHIHTSISLAELAATVHLSPFHFSRLFRQTTKLSPYQFVLQMKIDYSKKLMRRKAESLSEVAYSLNFTDQAHFSNVFKKITGVCPRKFMLSSAA